MQTNNIERYARHLVLKEIGGAGQAELLGSKIALVGAGGLGGPAGLYLAAAGVGHITVIDDDVVEISNLQRQVQFVQTDIGMGKAQVMGDTLEDLNPDCHVERKAVRLTAGNAQSLLAGHDIIVDGLDSFEARFAVNDAALTTKTPLVSGALGRFEGQVGVFCHGEDAPCYRCFVRDVPPDAETCAQVGVMGALAGVVGAMMAMETIKLITGAGRTLSGRLWLYDGLQSESRTVSLSKDPDCPACSRA